MDLILNRTFLPVLGTFLSFCWIHISGSYSGPQSWEFHCQYGIRGTPKSFKDYEKAVSETTSPRNPLGKQRKMVTSAVACALFLSWLLPKADLGPISVFFFLIKRKICIVAGKSKTSQSGES